MCQPLHRLFHPGLWHPQLLYTLFSGFLSNLDLTRGLSHPQTPDPFSGCAARDGHDPREGLRTFQAFFQKSILIPVSVIYFIILSLRRLFIVSFVQFLSMILAVQYIGRQIYLAVRRGLSLNHRRHKESSCPFWSQLVQGSKLQTNSAFPQDKSSYLSSEISACLGYI